MKCNYFVRNGIQYSSGTMIRLYCYNHIIHTVQLKNAIFVEYDNENKTYIVLIDGKKSEYEENYFNMMFCDIITESNTHKNATSNKEKSFADELNIDGLGLAWVWYIFIMLVAVIFYDRIVIWVVASIVFFQYRDKKLKEAGYK